MSQPLHENGQNNQTSRVHSRFHNQDLWTETKTILDRLLMETMTLETNKNEFAIIEKVSQMFDSLRSLINKQEKQLKQKIRHIKKKNQETIEDFEQQLRKYDRHLETIVVSNDDQTSSSTSLNTMKRELCALKVPKLIKFHVDGIDQLEQAFTDLLPKVQINEYLQNAATFSSSSTEKINGKKSVISMRGSTPNEIPIDAKWFSNRITVAGGNRQGRKTNQLSGPSGLFVDDDDTLYIADFNNHRIVKWKCAAKRGAVIAGGNGKGDGPHQLNRPYDVIKDNKNDSLIISDNGNLRVMRWSCRMNTTRGDIVLSNIACAGLTMDEDGYLYVVDEGKHEVRRFHDDDKIGTIVAGGNGKGNRLDQLHEPWYIFIDNDKSIYVSDWGNHRVMKWLPGAKQGIVVAGGFGKGNSLSHLSSPEGIFVDQSGNVYVSDSWNDRVMRWSQDANQGTVIIGRHRLSCPIGLSFNRHGHLFVVDWGNHRVERFSYQ